MSDLQSRTYDGLVAVTKSDTVADPAGPFAGLYVSVAGTIVLTDGENTTSTIQSGAAGTIINVHTVRVGLSTGATVFGLHGRPGWKPGG